MAKYGGFNYRGSYYGEIPRLPFSVEPFQAVALDYDKVLLSWGSPQGAVNGLRIVRNQDGYGELPEDGVVLFERNSDEGDFGDGYFIDGIDNFDDDDLTNDFPLVPGRFVYYRAWVRRTATSLWTVADDIFTILPKQHGTAGGGGELFKSTQDNFMDLLPRVYTSASQSPLDAVDTESDLYKFLKAFSFTLDEILTLADLALPDFSGRSTNPALLGVQIAQYGITPAPDDFVRRQKRLVREAIYMYSRKGTPLALGTLIEALTGFAPVVEQSPNLFLSNQDSTFNQSYGAWRTYGDCTLAVTNEILPPSGEDFQIDGEYSGKVVVTSANSRIQNGVDTPTTRGVPVKKGTSYKFSYFARSLSAGSLVNVTPVINWHNSKGDVVSTVLGTPHATTVSWANYGVTSVAPGFPFAVESYSVTSNVVTLQTTTNHTLTNGAIVTISGLGIPYDGKFTLTAVTANTMTYSLSTPNVPSTAVEATVSIEESYYASLELRFNSTGTLYVDMMQFANSSVTSYYEARSVQIFLNPSKSNYVNDPTFSGVIQDWTVTGVSVAKTYPASTLPKVYTGDSMLRVAHAAGNLVVSADTDTGGKPTGKFYTFSVYAQAPSGNETMSVKLTAIDSTNPSVSATSDPVVISTEWVRLSVTLYVPTEFVASSMYFTMEIKNSSSAGNVLNFDAAQLEPTFEPTIYFDGSLPAEYGTVWQGLTNNSPSHQYANKQNKIIRVIQELENFLPSNTPYVVNSFGGVETKAITQ